MTDLTQALEALEAGEFDRAHDAVKDLPGPDAAWIHAHLHREEGDMQNAAYWYRRAGRDAPDGSLEAERQAILARLGG